MKKLLHEPRTTGNGGKELNNNRREKGKKEATCSSSGCCFRKPFCCHVCLLSPWCEHLCMAAAITSTHVTRLHDHTTLCTDALAPAYS